MSVTMIRGYGLPAAEAGSYNGLHGFEGHRFAGRYAGSNRGLFNTLPDPELGGMGGFAGVGDIFAVGGQMPFGAQGREAFYQDQGAALPTFTAQQTRAAAASGGGMGTVALLGVAGLALFFILR